MTVSEMIKGLEQMEGDKELNFLVWDGNDNYEGKLNINEYDSCYDLELALEPRFAIAPSDWDETSYKIVDVPFTESDLEDFKDIVYENEVIDWVFDTHDGEEIELRLMSGDEYDNRRA